MFKEIKFLSLFFSLCLSKKMIQNKAIFILILRLNYFLCTQADMLK